MLTENEEHALAQHKADVLRRFTTTMASYSDDGEKPEENTESVYAIDGFSDTYFSIDAAVKEASDSAEAHVAHTGQSHTFTVWRKVKTVTAIPKSLADIKVESHG